MALLLGQGDPWAKVAAAHRGRWGFCFCFEFGGSQSGGAAAAHEQQRHQRAQCCHHG
ncbi:hypothetical protein ACFS32_07390 [Novosphingobium pokkalii]|uniref:hypothetical protein n=1 Tax=Novosphingobium pokkalii TaxID=1770194 RepID=UPI00363AC9F3